MISMVAYPGRCCWNRWSRWAAWPSCCWPPWRRLFRRPFETGATIYEFERIGWQSMGVVAMLGLFTGMVSWCRPGSR